MDPWREEVDCWVGRREEIGTMPQEVESVGCACAVGGEMDV